MIFGTVKDTVSIFYRTKNQVRGLCVGGDMAILQSSVKIDLTLLGGLENFLKKV